MSENRNMIQGTRFQSLNVKRPKPFYNRCINQMGHKLTNHHILHKGISVKIIFSTP